MPERLEEPERLGLHRVQVVEKERDRALRCRLREECLHRVEEAEAVRGVGVRGVRDGIGVQLGDESCEVAALRGRERVDCLRQGVRDEAQHARPRPVDRIVALDAPCGRDERAGAPCPLGEDLGRAALPDAGFPGQQQDPPVPGERFGNRSLEPVEELAPADVARARILDARPRRGRFAYRDLADRRLESIPAARDRRDHCARLAAISESGARNAHRARQRALGDLRVGPDRFEDLLLGDDPVAMTDQEEQEVEHLRLEREPFAPLAQLEALLIELVLPEGEDQSHRPRSTAPPAPSIPWPASAARGTRRHAKA